MRFRTAAGPGWYAEVDDSCNVVLVHQSSLGSEHRADVSDVEALRSALDAARVMAAVHYEQMTAHARPADCPGPETLPEGWQQYGHSAPARGWQPGGHLR